MAVDRTPPRHGGIRIGADGSVDIDVDKFFGDDNVNVVIPVIQHASAQDHRARLLEERGRLAAAIDARIAQYQPQIVQARAHRIGNYIWPPFFGCAAGLFTFVGAAVLLAVLFTNDSRPSSATSIAAVLLSLVAIVATLIFVIRFRARRAGKTVDQLELERDAPLHAQKKRLEEINAQLTALR